MAKNTIFLYIRMFIVLIISLYTVRIVIKTLGVEDYGIYGAVGGIVTIMSFLSQTVTYAAQRYFSFELGRNDLARLSKVFNSILVIYFSLAVFVALVAEFFGMWFLENQMVIPLERMTAAHWILHFSLLSFIVSILSSPFNAMIIAHENMKIYAYISVIEAIIKLAIVYLLFISPIDKLVFYALLMFLSHLLVGLIYGVYCARSYKETRLKLAIDKPIMKELVGYSSWTMFGSIAGAANNQGANLMLNSFFGPIANTSYSVSNQIGSTLQMFSANLFSAIRPQMIKRYALQQNESVVALLYKSTKYMALLLLFVMLPLFVEIHFVLTLWLGEVVEYMVDFSRLTMLYYFMLQLSNPLTVVAQAANKVKIYHVVVDSFMLLSLIVAYFFLRNGFPAQSVYWSMLGIMFIAHFIRLVIVKSIVPLFLAEYFKKSIVPFLGAMLVSCLLLAFVYSMFEEGWLRLFMVLAVSTLSIGVYSYFYALNDSERGLMLSFLKKKFLK